MATGEARDALPQLVHEARALEKPARTLTERAVEIGPYRKGGLWTVPELDAVAAIEREERQRRRIAELEEELEDIGISLLVSERLSSSSGKRTPARDVVRELGFEDVLDQLPPR